jgi:putative hydrolase of the HAD superfamily
MIRVVTFDAAGTLIRLLRPPGTTYAETARLFGYHLDPDRVQDSFRITWKTLAPPTECVDARPDDDRGWWRELVARTMEAAGYRIVPFDNYFDAVYQTFAQPGVWEWFPDVQATLTELSRLKVRLGVISNFDRRLYAILGYLGVLDVFEHIIISSEIGSGFASPFGGSQERDVVEDTGAIGLIESEVWRQKTENRIQESEFRSRRWKP